MLTCASGSILPLLVLVLPHRKHRNPSFIPVTLPTSGDQRFFAISIHRRIVTTAQSTKATSMFGRQSALVSGEKSGCMWLSLAVNSFSSKLRSNESTKRSICSVGVFLSSNHLSYYLASIIQFCGARILQQHSVKIDQAKSLHSQVSGTFQL